MRTRTKGIQSAENGEKIVNKQYQGRRIFARLGAVSQDEAEIWLRQEQNRIDTESKRSSERLFCDAAERYLLECQRKDVKSIDDIVWHLKMILPFIGTRPLPLIHSGTMDEFRYHRVEVDKVSPTTVNRTLEVVRTVLVRAARVWRGDDGLPWLPSAPLIEMLPEKRRQPYPITWEQQAKLFAELPPHLQQMALFAVNTGLRDENICGLRWSWERYIPDLKRSVFVIPPEVFKSNRSHVVILNDVAAKVIETCRDIHPEFVFTYKKQVKNKKLKEYEPDRVGTINSNAWQKARKRAGLEQVRVHDLRHTFGQRLRDAGILSEDRAVLLGHAVNNMSEHYATPTIARLIEMANLVQKTRDTPTLLRVVNG